MTRKMVSKRTRVLSLLLVLGMLIGLAPSVLTTPAEAIYHPENAPAATMGQLAATEDTFVASSNGGMLRVIDGKLYVWGPNSRFSLGLGTYNDEQTTASTIVPDPVLHDFNFGSDVVKIVASTYGGMSALTADGDVFSWGDIFNNYVFGYKPGVSTNGGRTPVQWDTSLVDGKIDYMDSSSLAVTVRDDQGNWYIGGCLTATYCTYNMVDDKTTENIMMLKPISEGFIDKLQKSYDAEYTPTETETDASINYKVRTAAERVGGSQRVGVKKVIPSYGGGSCFVITTDDRLFVLGINNHGQNFMPDDEDEDGNPINGSYTRSTDPIEVLHHPQNAAIAGADPSQLTTNGVTSAMLMPDGSVYIVGSGSAFLYPAGVNYRRPYKIYDATMMGAKCVKVFVSDAVVAMLTEDNSVYAIGKNANQFISTLTPADEPVFDATQVFTELSKQQTITGIYASSTGIMVVTKSGETFYTGDNSTGSAGNGTTESPAPGEIQQSVPTTIPPLEPVTANEIIYEIEDTEGFTYRTTGEKNNQNKPLVQKYKDGVATGAPTASMELKAGKTFKLNVWFNDFGKLTSWMVPIRFDPTYVKVVNGSGVTYADDQVVTPGATGAATGINKCFTTQQWAGGILIGDGGTHDTYPKICNADGWMSVAGYTMNQSASISGEVKMFSVDFTVVSSQTSATALFDFATDQNVKSTNVSAGYDSSGFAAKNYGPYWKVTMNDDDSQAQFQFKYDADTFVPLITTSVIPLTDMKLRMYRSDNNEVQKETSQVVGTGSAQKTFGEGYGVNCTNTSEIYTIQVETNNGANTASFPQSDWTVALKYPENGTTIAADYLTIVEQRETYLRVKLPDDFSQTDTGVLSVTAVNQRNTNKKAEILIYVKSYEAPEHIEIREKASLPNATATFDSITPASGTATFSVGYPDAAPTFSNLAIKWRLLDKNGNDLDMTDPKTVVTLQGTTQPGGTWNNGGAGFTAGTATISPVHTTFGDEYVILRAESLYDPSVYDEIKIKVHLKATEMKFRQDVLRMPTDTTKDLSSLLSIGPASDFYATNLVWSYEGLSEENPYITFAGNSIITSGSTPTPSNVTEEYEQVTVTDTISNLSATIKIAVLSLDSPIKPDSVKVVNLLGDTSDYITVSGLEVGDYITFYQEYGTPASETDKIRKFGPLTAAEAGSGTYNFPVKNFLKGEGGEIGMMVSRVKDASIGLNDYDRIPVGYDCEPSKVYGYVRLAGKADNSERNAGIAIQLTGLSSPDVVYTDANGYFEFTTYIIPGNYTMTIYQDNYLKRVIQADAAAGYTGLQIPSGVAEFAISTDENPILLYPGDLNADGAINTTDVNQYVRNWVGSTNTASMNFKNYDFYDGANQVIDLNDLDLVIRRHGWVRENYPKWSVPTQS